MKETTVSVVIPVFNAARYLEATLESVLDQSYLPLEIVIIDDGSWDNSRTIVQQVAPQARYYYFEHTAPPTPYNKGISLTNGDLIAFLDHDDLWLPDKLAWQVAAFRADPALAISFGMVEQFYSPDVFASPPPPERMVGHIPSAMMVSRPVFQQIGLFNPQWQVGYFLEWVLKATEQGLKIATLPHLLARRRIHNTNLGIRKQAQQREYAQVLKQHLDRNRRK